jgi:hypothetical protein
MEMKPEERRKKRREEEKEEGSEPKREPFVGKTKLY